jgi:hypothetical protein
MRYVLKLIGVGVVGFVGLVLALVVWSGIRYARETPEERALREATARGQRVAAAERAAENPAQEEPAALAQEAIPAAAPEFRIAADGVVTRADLGERWPLTVESAQLRCLHAGALSDGRKVAAVFMHAGGKTYALNGLSQSRAAKYGWQTELAPIVTASVQPLIKLGNELCERHGPTDKEPAFSGNGTFLVGSDVQPGTYRTSGGSPCYWARLRSLSGALDAIVANDMAQGPAVVQISKTDKAFQSKGCADWHAVDGGLVSLRPAQGS